MPLDQYIINDLKPFDLNTPIGELQEVFNQLTYSHVPIQKDGIYIGCLSETDVYCFDANEKVEDVLYWDPFWYSYSIAVLELLAAAYPHELIVSQDVLNLYKKKDATNTEWADLGHTVLNKVASEIAAHWFAAAKVQDERNAGRAIVEATINAVQVLGLGKIREIFLNS